MIKLLHIKTYCATFSFIRDDVSLTEITSMDVKLC